MRLVMKALNTLVAAAFASTLLIACGGGGGGGSSDGDPDSIANPQTRSVTYRNDITAVELTGTQDNRSASTSGIPIVGPVITIQR